MFPGLTDSADLPPASPSTAASARERTACFIAANHTPPRAHEQRKRDPGSRLVSSRLLTPWKKLGPGSQEDWRRFSLSPAEGERAGVRGGTLFFWPRLFLAHSFSRRGARSPEVTAPARQCPQ